MHGTHKIKRALTLTPLALLLACNQHAATPYATPPAPTPQAVVFDGESTTRGSQGPGWPHHVCAAAGIADCVNSGIGGQRISQLTADPPPAPASTSNRLVLWIGLNDLILDHSAGADIYAGITAYIHARQNDGWAVTIMTVPTATTHPTLGPTQDDLDTELAALNAHIVNNAARADRVVQLHEDTMLHPGNPYRMADGIHYTEAGDRYIAERYAVAAIGG